MYLSHFYSNFFYNFEYDKNLDNEDDNMLYPEDMYDEDSDSNSIPSDLASDMSPWDTSSSSDENSTASVRYF